MQQQVQEAVREANAAPQILSRAEMETYQRDGFLVPKFRFSSAEIGELRNMILKLAAEKPGAADIVVNRPHVLGATTRQGNPDWMKFVAHPTVLDMIEQIQGPDIIVRGAVAFYKPAGIGPETPWHRDAVTVPIAPLASTQLWIAVTDSCVDNSCLRFIPGTHISKERGKHTIKTERVALLDSEFDENQAVDVELEAGQMVLFDLFTIHSARPNTGTRERMSLAPRYMPGSSKFNHDVARPKELQANGALEPSNRPLILVRGRDHAGNDFTRGHPV